MIIKKRLSKELSQDILNLINTSLKNEGYVSCEVIIVSNPGETSGTKLTLTIDSPVNYNEYVEKK